MEGKTGERKGGVLERLRVKNKGMEEYWEKGERENKGKEGVRGGEIVRSEIKGKKGQRKGGVMERVRVTNKGMKEYWEKRERENKRKEGVRGGEIGKW